MPDRPRNPPYNRSFGPAIQAMVPPFDLTGVVMRMFPLRASHHQLQLFCNRYLNIAPRVAWFEPAAAVVLLGVINYGRMAPTTSNYGYTSQNEVMFAVPLNWYRIENGRRVFHAQATVSPFIFVDEDTSLWTGREVFGWPKTRAWLQPGINEWARDPRSPRTLFTLATDVYRELFAAQRQEPRVLLEIEQAPEPTISEFPPDPFNPQNPLLAWPRALLNMWRGSQELLDALTGLPMRGYPGLEQGSPLFELMTRTFGSFNILAQLPPASTLNLKQFRNPHVPELISYQALVNSNMAVKRLSRGGMLGDMALLQGDFSAGYQVRIHRHPGWPIIESLGLKVAHEDQEHEHSVAILEPTLPFWVDVDFEYGEGEVICWRTRRTHWAPPPELATAPPRIDTQLAASQELGDPAQKDCECGTAHLYNTTEGGAIQQVYGPFQFPDVTVRTLPLLADWDRLKSFCDDYLNDGRTTTFIHHEDGRYDPAPPTGGAGDAAARNLFVPWGRYVYMIVTSYEAMTSEINIGWWTRRRVTFSFPVRWYRWYGDRWKLASFALVSPFVYVDTGQAATMGREMQGWPAAEATIESPASRWLDRAGPARRPHLLALSTNVNQALHANQPLGRRLLLEVTSRDPLPATDMDGWKHIAADWGDRLAAETKRKAWWNSHAMPDSWGGWTPHMRLQWCKSAALEVMLAGQSINHVSLKQFRDAADPNRACFQAISLHSETLERIHDLRSIDAPLHVAVRRFPTQPIVRKLGLAVKWTDSTGGEAIDYLQPLAPFWLRATMTSELGRDVKWRAGSEVWHAGERPPLYFEDDQTKTPPANAADWADTHIHTLQDYRTKHVQDAVRTEARRRWSKDWWEQRAELAGALQLSRWHDALAQELRPAFPGAEPQLAIESILANKWLNFERGPDHEPAQRKPFIIRRDTIGHPVVRTEFAKTHGFDTYEDDYWEVPGDGS